MMFPRGNIPACPQRRRNRKKSSSFVTLQLTPCVAKLVAASDTTRVISNSHAHESHTLRTGFVRKTGGQGTLNSGAASSATPVRETK